MIGRIDLLHRAKEGVDADEDGQRERHDGERHAIADLERPHEEDEKCQDEEGVKQPIGQEVVAVREIRYHLDRRAAASA